MKTRFQHFLAAVLMAVFACASVSFAQNAPSVDPPYWQKLLRLSELIGSVHFLRNLCGEEGTVWRDSMNELLVSEKPTPERKSSLIASFNHGYRSFAGTYIRCTPSAIDALNRFMKEGELLSQDISTRYGS